MLRLSRKDLDRLGRAARTRSAGASRRRPASGPAEGTAEDATQVGGRLARRAHDGPEVTVEIDLPPRPKERARTFVDERALVRAFLSAGGDARRFVARVKGRKGGEGGAGEGGVMRTVTPEATRQFEEAVAMVARRAMASARLEPFSCPVEVDLDFRFEGDPATWPTAQGDGDLDNLEKAALDGMNGVAYVDDRLIVRKAGMKRCAAVPGITVRVRPAVP